MCARHLTPGFSAFIDYAGEDTLDAGHLVQGFGQGGGLQASILLLLPAPF